MKVILHDSLAYILELVSVLFLFLCNILDYLSTKNTFFVMLIKAPPCTSQILESPLFSQDI